jgi:hypothetical protein
MCIYLQNGGFTLLRTNILLIKCVVKSICCACLSLRFPGVILLVSFKEQLKETTVDPTVPDKLALSRDPDADANVTVSSSDFKVFRRRSKDRPVK